MEFKDEQIQSLVNNPTESLGVELKRWIDPSNDDGVVKLAKACIAMRNNNGGFIVIGFDNETLQPDQSRPADVRATFHIDSIQTIVSKFASEVFEVAVKFGLRDAQQYPVICVPAGVRNPVASKSSLKSSEGQIKDNQVYVRCFANGRVSTSEIKWQDWGKLIEICMENRELDIGRFIRRHLTTPELTSLMKPDVKAELLQLLNDGANRYATVAEERGLKVAKHGTMEAGFCIAGKFPTRSATRSFLNEMVVSNPRLTGWPFWIDSSGFVVGKQTAPYHVEGGWEALIALIGADALSIWDTPRGYLDFWQMFPDGRFYHRRALEDDGAALTPENPPPFLPKPNVILDFGLPVLRVYEVLLIGIRFAKALGCEPAQTTVKYGFRWSGLKGRALSSWAEPGRIFYNPGTCYQDVVFSTVEVPLETAESALFQQTHQATTSLYEAFGGHEVSLKLVESSIEKTFAQRR